MFRKKNNIRKKIILKLRSTHEFRIFRVKKVFSFCSILFFFACSNEEFLMTEFYVKNTSEKTINFEVSYYQTITDFG